MSKESDIRENFQDVLKSFDNAMLTTTAGDGHLRSRPMRIADVEHGGDVWFVTAIKSVKVDEIEQHPQVNVSMQNGSQFLSLSGAASLIRDRAKIDELWSEAWKVWFPDGKSDPDIVLIHVSASEGEYWDNSGLNGLKYLLEAGKAYFAGERMDTSSDPDQHASVKL